MKHYPETPTTCNVSDMLNSIAQFVEEYPNWMDDRDMTARMAMAYMMFTKMCTPDMVSEDEYEFVMNLHSTLQEIGND
jgi:hypothetical protein